MNGIPQPNPSTAPVTGTPYHDQDYSGHEAPYRWEDAEIEALLAGRPAPTPERRALTRQLLAHYQIALRVPAESASDPINDAAITTGATIAPATEDSAQETSTPDQAGTPTGSWPFGKHHRITDAPSADLIIVEGDEAQAAVDKLFPDSMAISVNPKSDMDAYDWAALKGRTVRVWPNACSPTLASIAELAETAGAAEVYVVNFPMLETLLHRAPPEGWNATDVLKVAGLDACVKTAAESEDDGLWQVWKSDDTAPAAPPASALALPPSLTTWEPETALIGTPEIDDPKDPSEIADKVIAALFWSRGTQLIRSIHDQLYLWTGTSYRPVESKYLRSWLYRFTRKAVIVSMNKNGQIVKYPYTPNKYSIDHIVDALEAIAFKEADQFPFWLDVKDNPNRPSPKTIIPFPDGLLSFERWRTDPACALIPHTPQWFGLHCLPYRYDSAATCPQFLAFLDSILPGDAEAILALQMWLGYCLTPDTSQHKALLVIGPPRAGKGVLFRVITALLGEHNVAAPGLSSLAQNFGLQALIGKHAAIIADAHAPNNLLILILDKLKGIIGEDAMTIDRKNREPVTLKLGCRIMMAANELSAFPDPSGALAARLIMIQLRKTFVGREDRGLETRLLAELPGILNWALAGLQKLLEQGRLLQPQSGAASLQQVRHLTSPILKFVEDMCEYPAPGKRIPKENLREAYDLWAMDEDVEKISGTHFGVKLHAACPEVEMKTHGKRGEDRVKDYCNITLSEEGREFVLQRHSGEMSPRTFLETVQAKKERDALAQVNANMTEKLKVLEKEKAELERKAENEEFLRRQIEEEIAKAGMPMPKRVLGIKAKIEGIPAAVPVTCLDKPYAAIMRAGTPDIEVKKAVKAAEVAAKRAAKAQQVASAKAAEAALLADVQGTIAVEFDSRTIKATVAALPESLTDPAPETDVDSEALDEILAYLAQPNDDAVLRNPEASAIPAPQPPSPDEQRPKG